MKQIKIGNMTFSKMPTRVPPCPFRGDEAQAEWTAYWEREIAAYANQVPVKKEESPTLGLWTKAEPIIPKRTSKKDEERKEPSRPWQDSD